MINGFKYPKEKMIELYNEWFILAINEVKSMNQTAFDEMVAM